MTVDPAAAAFVREVGRRVRLHRLVQRLTQQEIADRTGLSRSFISLFEQGAHGIDITALARIATALGVPLTELVAEPPGGWMPAPPPETTAD